MASATDASTTATPAATIPEFVIPAASEFTCYDPTDLVKITITSTAPKAATATKTFHVPRDLLRWHSSYFAAALDLESDFYKSDDEGLTLSERIHVFEIFVCWIYTGRLMDPQSASSTSAKLYHSYARLVRVWIFADKRGIPGLGNAAIDMMHELMSAAWKFSRKVAFDVVYNETMPGCLLRKFFIDMHTQVLSYKRFRTHLTPEVAGAEFIVEAMHVLVRNGESYDGCGREEWTKVDRCQWHDHSGPGGKLRLESRK